MFKPNSGRKQESGVWKHFEYETAKCKSRCKVLGCCIEIKGKNTTNLVNHLKSKHKDIATEMEMDNKKTKGSQQFVTVNKMTLTWLTITKCNNVKENV